MSIPPNSNSVKSTRRYDSVRRRAQADQTRRDIIEAALRRFVRHGYSGTTVASIASDAGVVVETVYRVFGGKAALFKAVVEAAVAGGAARASVPIEDRPAVRRMIEERDPRRLLELHADTQPGIHGRVGPLYRVLMEAASADRDLAGMWTELETQRLNGMRRIAKHLAESGALRSGISVDEAGDVLWTVNSLAVYDLLVRQRGWPPERYRDWIASTNARALLDVPASTSAPPRRRR